MKILIACEFSGVIREAFKAKGHEAISCDLEDSEIVGDHYKGNVFDILYDSWDMMICHPPCRYLAVSGARWMKNRAREELEAFRFAKSLWNASHISRIVMENPVSLLSTYIRKPDQIIQPWEFGHGETKKTCLWLKNVPLLKPTNIVEGRESRIYTMGPSKHRSKDRSRTYLGIALAMADQWNF